VQRESGGRVFDYGLQPQGNKSDHDNGFFDTKLSKSEFEKYFQQVQDAPQIPSRHSSSHEVIAKSSSLNEGSFRASRISGGLREIIKVFKPPQTRGTLIKANSKLNRTF